ncbi:MAG: dimethyladenosine transferase [Acidimicrobiales bacterium]|nr:dimethyladenosine transferase [Acidimicrobiales bacterium]
MAEDVISVERLINAPAEAIFPYLANADRHREIDGSGTVREAKGNPEPLRLGSKFGMSMKLGIPYSMVSTVIEFEENRRIAWQTHGPTALGKYVGGRIWRYELEPTDGGTLVRETWDITQESPLSILSTRRMAGMAERNMEKTLARIEELVTD